MRRPAFPTNWPTIAPCLPKSAQEPPTGPGWIHEIKHDGFRILARRVVDRVRLYTRNGYNLADRFPRIVDAIASLPVESCFIDGGVVVVDERSISVFELLRSWRHDHAALLYAFDLIELDGEDLRSSPIEDRKRVLAHLLPRKRDGIILNEHYEGNGPIIYQQACRFGCEGIVSKPRSRYRSGRVNDWLKIKNPTAPAVKREAEEDWAGERRLP